MQSVVPLLLSIFAAGAAAQITLQPTTIRGPGVCPVTTTRTSTTTVTQVVISTTTRRETLTSTATVTTTKTTCAPSAPCPTITTTPTVCRTCLVAACTETKTVTKPAGCANPVTATANLACDVDDVCNKIGCKTVWEVATKA